MSSTIESVEDLDALLHEEKRNVARGLVEEAWDAAVAEGIEAPIVAESAVTAILLALDEACGDDAVRGLIARLSDLETAGRFRCDYQVH